MNYSLKMRDHDKVIRKLGSFERAVASVRNHRGSMPDEMIINIIDLDKKQFIEISDMIDNYPDWSDEDIAEYLIDE